METYSFASNPVPEVESPVHKVWVAVKQKVAKAVKFTVQSVRGKDKSAAAQPKVKPKIFFKKKNACCLHLIFDFLIIFRPNVASHK